MFGNKEWQGQPGACRALRYDNRQAPPLKSKNAREQATMMSIKSKTKDNKAKKSGGDNRVLLQVQLPRRLRDAFQASCAAEGLTVSSVVRAFMSEVVLRATQNALNQKESQRDG